MCMCGSPATGASNEVGLPLGAVLDLHGRPGRVVPEAHPADRPRIGAVLAAGALACPADFLGDVAHGAVIRAVDGVPDQRALGRRRREFRGHRDGFVRAEDQIEARQLALMLGPGFAVIPAPAFEQPGHFLVARHFSGIDANGVGDERGHIGPPGRAAIPARIVRGQPAAFFELPSGLVHRPAGGSAPAYPPSCSEG